MDIGEGVLLGIGEKVRATDDIAGGLLTQGREGSDGNHVQSN